MRTRQINILLFLVIVLFGFFTERVLSQSSKNTSQLEQFKKVTVILRGDYLRSDYIEILEKTYSPLQAWVFGTYQLLKVSEEEKGLLLQPIINFHEGGPDFILRKDGSIITRLAAGHDTSNLSIEIIDTRHFKLGFDKFKPMLYSFVGNADRYVTNKVLAGEYSDEKGRHYIFGTDGWAVYPNDKFEYQVGLDHILLRFDYFFDKKTEDKVYAFKIHNDMLEIFGTSGEINQIVDKRPLLSLKKVGPAK